MNLVAKAAGVLVLAAAAAPGEAQVFRDRAPWLAAIGGTDVTEDFSGYPRDVVFRTQPVAISGGMTLRQLGTSTLHEFRNFIDSPPLGFADHNGTAHVSCWVDFPEPGETGIRIEITFDRPVAAWGADFWGAASGERLDVALINSRGVEIGVMEALRDRSDEWEFLGFVAPRGEVVQRLVMRSRRRFLGTGGEGFGFDNLALRYARADFRALGGILGGGFTDATIRALSADGQTLVGSGTRLGNEGAFRWRNAGGMSALVSEAFASRANGVSGDGSVVAGNRVGGPPPGADAFRWTEGSGPLALGSSARRGLGVSADGLTIVGAGEPSGVEAAFKWTEGGGVQYLGFLGGGATSVARAASADGSVVVGQSGSTSGPQAFRLTPGGMGGLGDLPGGLFQSDATAVNTDGSVVAGWSASSRAAREAFRWTEAGGMTGLGLLGGATGSAAAGLSGDGALVVGACDVPGTDGLAFVWTPGTGLVSLKDFLQGRYGLDLSGWALHSAVGISDDGRVIAGRGTNPQSQGEDWLVALPNSPCAAPLRPTSVVASDGTVCGYVRVGWIATDNVNGFEVWRGPQSSGVGATLIGVDTASPYFDATPAPGTTQWYFVRARGLCGEHSLFAPGDSGFRIASSPAPTGVTATNGTLCDSVQVSWNAVLGATSYTIWRAPTGGQPEQVGTDNASPFSDVPPNRSGYTYYVKAVTVCGPSDFSAGDLGYRAANPVPPTGVAAGEGSPDYVRVAWNPIFGASGYTIWRATVNSPGTSVQIGMKSASPYYDLTAVPGQTYWYFVRTVTPCGQGGFSLGDSGRRQ